ncbi:MAG: hypothetical protein HYX86_00550 [Chloroflexi bacterium]|nr:hypothetical protein [Chloroflexota bacterium]
MARNRIARQVRSSHHPESDASERAERDRLRNEILAKRQRIVAELENERGSKVLTMIHRHEPWEGHRDYLTTEDTESILGQIVRTAPEKPIDLILHTPGGLALAAEMIAMSLKAHPGRVTVMVPFYAMSGGTMIALAADEILMEGHSVLGPLDPQIGGLPAGALVELLNRKPIEAVQDQTLIQADIARLALQRTRNFVQWLLRGRMSEQQVVQVADFLTGGYTTHDTPITFEVAKILGFPVGQGLPRQVYDLFETCQFGNCPRPSLADFGK